MIRCGPFLLIAAVLSTFVFAVNCGCGHEGESDGDVAAIIADYGQLPGLKETHHVGLQDELARLVSEKATPALLTGMAGPTKNEAPPSENGQPTGDVNPATVNAGTVLAGLFPANRVQEIDMELDRVYPASRFQFNPLGLSAAVELRLKYDQQRRSARAALAGPVCDFELQHTHGLLADMTFVDVARIYNRLEAILAAESIRDHAPSGTIEPLAAMFRMIGHLAAEKHVVPRLSAAELRAEALVVVEAVVRHRRTTRSTLQQLDQLISRQLASWPADAGAWIGDRALGLHTYEMLRDDQLMSVLTWQELDRFRRENRLAAMVNAVARTLDQDEMYYLNTMRSIIESCDQPYYERKKIFFDIREQLHKIRETSEYPIIADHLLLRQIRHGHEIQARDRARCEAWSLALAAVLGNEPPGYKINPMTGKPYEVVRHPTRVVVRGLDLPINDEPVIVPLPPPTTRSSDKGDESVDESKDSG